MTDTPEHTKQLIGQVVAGRYLVKDLLGAGGMSEVYLAEDNQVFGEPVAIKLLSLNDSAILLRFNEEAKGQAFLGKHPHICGVKDTVLENGKLKYIVMDYIPGESLNSYMNRNELSFHDPPVRNLLIQIMIEVSLTLHYAHITPVPSHDEIGIIHRDLKPENIMLQDLGGGRLSPVLVDFGLCRIGQGVGYTSDSRIFGTPIYASMEQLLSPTKVTRLSDIFSLGMILYWIYAGEMFYSAAEELSPFGIVSYFQENCMSRLQVISNPKERAIVEKCIAERPEDRYQTAEDVALALQNLLEEQSEAEGRKMPLSQNLTLNYASRKSLVPTVDDTSPPGKTTKLAKKRAKGTLLMAPSASAAAQKKSSKIPAIALSVLAAIVLLGGGGYFLFREDSEPKKKKPAASSMKKKSQNTPAPMRKKAKQKQTKKSRARKSKTATRKPNEAIQLKAQYLFKKWDLWCRQHHPRRKRFKSTPTLHSDCIRRKKTHSYVKKTKEYAVGREIVVLLKRKFCTGYNLRHDSSMRSECRRMIKFIHSINLWEKIDNCQKTLNGLLRRGQSDEKNLPGKCRGVRWFLTPRPKIAPYCQRLYRKKGTKGLPSKCKPLLKAFPALFIKP